jgi:hypothetical protein
VPRLGEGGLAPILLGVFPWVTKEVEIFTQETLLVYRRQV